MNREKAGELFAAGDVVILMVCLVCAYRLCHSLSDIRIDIVGIHLFDYSIDDSGAFCFAEFVVAFVSRILGERSAYPNNQQQDECVHAFSACKLKSCLNRSSFVYSKIINFTKTSSRIPCSRATEDNCLRKRKALR